MLKLQQAPTFEAKVEIPLPGDKVAEVKCTFRWMHMNDLRDFLMKVADTGRLSSPLTLVGQRVLAWLSKVPCLRGWASKRLIAFRSDFDVLNQVLISWEGVDMPWGEEACKQLLELYPNAVSLIIGAWCNGLAERRLGN